MPNLDIIEINDQLTYNAKLLASAMSTPQIRKRGMIDMLGINCAISYLQAKKIRVDTRRSVFNIPILFEEFKITDIYYNNYRIDVITLFKEKTIKIPKVHLDVDIMPDFYFIVQIGAKIKEAKIIGFIEAKSVLGCSCDSKFYYPTLDLIFDVKKFLIAAKHSTPTRTILGKHADCMGLFLKFIDNDLSNVYKSQLIQHLMNCDSCRKRFIDAIEFENVANNIRHYPELMKRFEYKMQPVEPNANSGQINALEESLSRVEIEDDILTETQDDSEVEENIIDPLENESKQQNKNQNKKAIDSIYKEVRNFELPPIKTIMKSKHRHKIIAVSIMFIVLISVAFISVKGIYDIRNKNDEIEELQNNSGDISEFEMLYGIDEDNPTHEARLIPKQRDINSFSIQQPVQSKPTYSPSVEKIAWEAPESVVKKEDYTKFLQLAGKNIKLNLQNDLLLIRDVPINKFVTINIKVAANGDVQSIKLLKSSGSNPIDASIDKVVKDTLRFMKPPAHGIIRPIELSLTIELN